MPLSPQEARRLSCHISTNLEVLANITDKQRAALITVLQDSAWTEVSIVKDFSLPDEWLFVTCLKPYHYEMGISPEGEVHS